MAFNPLNRKLDKNGNPIVTKEELDKSGMSLRDFLNKERGLTRRKEEASPEARQNAKEGMSMTRMDPEKADDAKRLEKQIVARDTALKMQEGERAVAAHKAKQAAQKEADEAASLGIESKKRGGSVSSASRRADGIATKGKTRGKIC